MPKRKIIKRDITEEQFFALLGKAAQPIESDSESIETSDIVLSDDCSETDTHSDTIEDISD